MTNNNTYSSNSNTESLGRFTIKHKFKWWLNAFVNPVYNVVTFLDWAHKDKWTKASPLEQQMHVKNTLVKATQLVLSGEAIDVESVLQTALAEVVKDDSWEEWKKQNQQFVNMMHAAQNEVNIVNNLHNAAMNGEDITIRVSHTHFNYIPKPVIDSLLSTYATADNTTSNGQFTFKSENEQQASSAAFGGDIIDFIKQNPIPSAMLGGAIVIGIIAFSSKNGSQGQSNIQYKQLK